MLIIHADDLAAAHSIDAASFEALDRGDVSSASIMMTCPWVPEVAAYARAHPDADLGLHLTLTSEWSGYRWGPLAPIDRVPSLVDSTGALAATTEEVAARAVPDEVERELRAQIARARSLGIRPTHLDGHMGATTATPALAAVLARVARDEHLPFLTARAARRSRTPNAADPFFAVDRVVIAGPEIPRERWLDFYLDAIRSLQPGLTYMIVHLGRDDAELEAVTAGHDAYGAAWRARDADVVRSDAFRRALRDHHVVVIRWKQLQHLLDVPATPSPPRR